MKNALPDFVPSFVLGAILWAFSKPITHRVEPWDAKGLRGLYYPVALLVAGFAGGLMARRIRPAWMGLVLGQFFYGTVILSRDSLWPLALIALSICSVCALPGLYLGNRLRSK